MVNLFSNACAWVKVDLGLFMESLNSLPYVFLLDKAPTLDLSETSEDLEIILSTSIALNVTIKIFE